MIDEKYWGEKEPDKKKDAQGPKVDEKHISVLYPKHLQLM